MVVTHAVVIGIDNYEDGFGSLKTAVSDAEKFSDYLKNDYDSDADQKNTDVKLLKDAKKSQIFDAISSLEGTVNRNDPIIFFFSGFAGQSETDSEDGEKEGLLCPADVLKEGGISATSLLNLFDQISRSCGNNIVSIFDAGRTRFNFFYFTF